MHPAHLSVDLGLLILAAYLIGSVPFGLMVGLSKGVDVRLAGSRNIGASNVGRLLGRPYFFGVLGLDAAKALVPVVAATAVVHAAGPERGPAVYGLWMGVGFAAILGHMFSVYLGFRGGKGVASTAGALLGFWPYFTLPAVIMISVFVVVFLRTRYISLGSMAGAVTFPVSYLALGLMLGWGPLGPQWPLMAFSVVLAALVVGRHRSNIGRLLAGTENRAVRKA